MMHMQWGRAWNRSQHWSQHPWWDLWRKSEGKEQSHQQPTINWICLFTLKSSDNLIFDRSLLLLLLLLLLFINFFGYLGNHGAAARRNLIALFAASNSFVFFKRCHDQHLLGWLGCTSPLSWIEITNTSAQYHHHFSVMICVYLTIIKKFVLRTNNST